MNSGKTIFAQLMDFIPPYEFRKCVDRYNGNYKVKSFSCWDRFLCMAFAQITYRESLRDIQACLRATQSKLYHLGIRGKVSRNTLAHANQLKDREKLITLGRIVYPHIIGEWQRRIAEIGRTEPMGILLSDIPSLIEGKLQYLVDVVVLVYISAEEQVKRLMKRNGCSREDALLRLASQMPIDDKIQYADIVINN